MKGPCEHCGLPDKSQWLQRCRYVGGYPDRETFIASTFDAPCALEDYDEVQAALDRDNNRFMMKIAGVTVVVAIVFLLLVSYAESGAFL